MMKSLLTLFAVASVSSLAFAQQQSAFVDAAAFVGARAAGDTVCKSDDVTMSVAFEDTYKTTSLTSEGDVVNQVVIDGQKYMFGDGVQGKNNAKEAELKKTVSKGAVFQFDVEADGYLYVISKVDAGKAYYVADNNGPTVGFRYAYSASVFNLSNGDNYAFTLPSLENNPGVFSICDSTGLTVANEAFLEAGKNNKLAPSDTCYTAAGGDKTWSGNASGVIAFQVEKGKSYLLYGGGSKITCSGFVFIPGDTELATIKAEKAEVENAIKNVTIDELDANEPIYNILGNRVSKGYKGICIQGGRKFIVK